MPRLRVTLQLLCHKLFPHNEIGSTMHHVLEVQARNVHANGAAR